jgi:aminoglycoside N3'-acetyltransferase
MTTNQFLGELTFSDILQGFKKIGIIQGMSLEVHGSLSSFGYVKGGAHTIIDALISAVGNEGALVMPSFPMSAPLPLDAIDIQRGLTCKIKIFDPQSDERSGMGIIPDTFRKRPDVLTGVGLHRVSAWGKDKAINCNGLSNLIENNGWALLIGVDIYRLTSMHYVESNLPDQIRNIFKPSPDILKNYPPDQWYIETGGPPVKAWYKIQDQAYQKGYITDHFIGKSKLMLFKICNVTDLYKHALETDPLGLYGLS